MDRGDIGLATKLLVKAQATTFDAEAAALTERAYRLLAKALNSCDDQVTSPGVARRRERRHLRDRRTPPDGQRPRPEASGLDVPSPAVGMTNRRGRRVDWIETPGLTGIDMRF